MAIQGSTKGRFPAGVSLSLVLSSVSGKYRALCHPQHRVGKKYTSKVIGKFVRVLRDNSDKEKR
jgi:hypothetical protein